MSQFKVRSIAFVCVVAAATSHLWAAIDLPFKQVFDGHSVPDGWTVDQAEGSSVVAKDGFLIFESPADKYAVVRHELGADNVTVTARIHDAATLFVAWDDGTYIGTGKVSPTPFARFHTIERREGQTSERDHTGCSGSAAHLMRIQLGEDCIRFQAGKGDGDPQWLTLRTIKRSPQYAGAPKVIVIGKNLDVIANKEMLVDTDSVGRGNRGLLASVEVVETPVNALRITEDERSWGDTKRPDPVADLLKNKDSDPTFEAVARFHPEMKFKREIVGVPGQVHDIGIDRLGRIDNSPWAPPIAWFEFGEQNEPLATKPEELRHRLLDGYVPIDTITTTKGNSQYEMEVFGWSKDFSPTNDLYGYVKLTVWAGGDSAELPTKITLRDNTEKQHVWEVKPSDTGMLTLCIRFKHPDPSTVEQISLDEYLGHHAKAERAWRDRIAKSAPFEVPDPRVNEAYRAWIAYSLLNADVINDFWEVHDGAGFYDIVFGHSMSRYATVMDQYGQGDYAAKLLATQIHYQQSNGHYMQECGLPDQGAFVMALANHYLIGKDAQWLEDNKDALTKGCEWIIERRGEAPNEGMCRGLIKFRPYNDYNDPVFNYLGNVLCCQALEESAKALRGIGDDKFADRYAAEGAAYRKNILDSMDTATIEHNGVQMIPIEPDTHRLLKLSKYTGGEYYGLVAADLMDTNFFSVNDHRANLYVNMLENQGGLAAGVCEFQEGIDHAYTGGYLQNCLRRGQIEKMLLGFWSYMAYGMTRDSYSPVEVTLYKSGENHYTLPHTYSCTQQLKLLRLMLLREEGDDLILTQGIPRDWLSAGKRIEVREAPTYFGPVSYSIDVVDSNELRMHLVPPMRDAPKSISIHLRNPQHLKIADVDSNAGENIKFDDQVITLSNSTEPLDLTVKFK